MAVENLSVTMSANSPNDTVSATIRGKTKPVIGQSFSIDLDDMTVNFEIETVNEKRRGPDESLYTITRPRDENRTALPCG